MADGGSQQRKPDFRTVVADVKAMATVLAREAEAVLGRRTARVLGGLVLFAILVGILLALLNWYIAPSGAPQKKDVVATLAQILGGAALLSGLYFTWRTLQVNREGQITERFTRAIDQLGATDNEGDKLFEIRIGGIYALERIARESEEDYWPIMEVLSAYVRQHSTWRSEEGQQGEEDATTEKKPNEKLREVSETPEVPTPGPDIHAIITVLRRRTSSFGHGEPERLDLHKTNLMGANLMAANLVGADLSGANFSGARLSLIDLSEARLWDANLSGANLWFAILSGANLQGANLQDAKVTDEQLADALSLQGATMPTGSEHP